MSDALTELRRELAQITDLRTAARVLEWDQLVMMPRGGAVTRGDHLATVGRLAHELFVRDEIGELIETAASQLTAPAPSPTRHASSTSPGASGRRRAAARPTCRR